MTRKGHCFKGNKPGKRSMQSVSRRKARQTRTEKRSLRTEKQNAQGTGRPSGASTTHCIVIEVAVDSKACLANDS
jgi:hypothetical protein